MTTIVAETVISAPIEVCFDLCLDVQEHAKSLGRSGERIVGGVTEGRMGLGDTIILEGRHFGFLWRLGVKVTEYDRPHRFVDEMVKGPFKSVRHEHLFVEADGRTKMTDVFVFAGPLGPLGRLAEVLFLRRHMRELILTRCAYLKRLAEGTR